MVSSGLCNKKARGRGNGGGDVVWFEQSVSLLLEFIPKKLSKATSLSGTAVTSYSPSSLFHAEVHHKIAYLYLSITVPVLHIYVISSSSSFAL